MKIRKIRSIPGPNIYHNKEVLVMTLDLEDLAETDSLAIPGFIERLLDVLPGLHEHHCSPGRRGGFVERLHRGTYFAHMVEHIALELSEPAGIPVTYGKSVYGGEPGVYQVIVRSKSEAGMSEILRVAVELAEAIARNQPYPLHARLEEIGRIIARNELGPSTRSIVEAARERSIPVMRLNNDSLVQLGYGKYRKLIQAAVTSQTSAIALETASDKELTKRLLDDASIPVPRGETVSTRDGAVDVLGELGAPVVVKPLDGNHGKGVTLNVTTAEQMREAFDLASTYSSSVLIEEQFEGKDYRVLVVGGKLVAAAERMPAHVIGDGVRTLAALIEEANQDPRRGEGHEKSMTRITMDAAALTFLARRNLTLAHIPAAGETVLLRETANLSTGGTATDVTDRVHPHVRLTCERAARVIGLDVCGIDLILHDIAEPMTRRGNGIIEVNAGPGLRMHLDPSHGTPRPVGKAIVDALYPPGAPSRIPILSITGTNGKTTITKMIGHVLSLTGANVGMTTTGGIFIGGQQVATGDTTGPISARTVLSDPSIDVAVLETARGGIVRRGLGYDWSDVGVVSNVQPDHIGQDGIETLDDIVHIKSLIPERVREGGTLVLNADDERVVKMAEIPRIARIPKQVVYFSLYADHLRIRRHVASGGKAYFVRSGWLVEAEKGAETPIVDVATIPSTFNGTADFQIANVLAVAAACRAQGVDLETLKRGLTTFVSDEHNLGRANIYCLGPGYVMVDYGHNPEAFRAICRMTSKWTGHTITGVIGVPGDRADSLIEECGRVIAQGFDRLFIREDRDRRGRAPGEAPRILCDAIRKYSTDTTCRVIANEDEAIHAALDQIGHGEVVVIFFDDNIEHITALLRERGAEPVTTIPDIGTARAALRAG